MGVWVCGRVGDVYVHVERWGAWCGVCGRVGDVYVCTCRKVGCMVWCVREGVMCLHESAVRTCAGIYLTSMDVTRSTGPSPSILAHCKQSNIRGSEGLGTRLQYRSIRER